VRSWDGSRASAAPRLQAPELARDCEASEARCAQGMCRGLHWSKGERRETGGRRSLECSLQVRLGMNALSLSPTAAPPARPTTVGRLLDFIGQMFPPAVYIPSGIASFASVYFALQALAGVEPLRITWRAVCGAFSVVAFMLLMRVYDELKDAESDLRLGRAGDPKYRDRPIVTGRIRIEDIVALKWGVIGLLLALNLPMGLPWPLLGFGVTFGLVWLSSRWFFWPRIQKNLLLALATHNPLVAVIAGYVLCVFVADFGPGALDGRALAVLLAAWMPLTAWEVSRKVRAPGEETEYQTYSMLLGWRIAAWLPVLFVAVATACYVSLALSAGVSWIFPAALLAAAGVVLAACARFRLAPSTRSANLRPFVEVYALVATVGFPLALALAHGLRVAG
jgi:hypothetical protein